MNKTQILNCVLLLAVAALGVYALLLSRKVGGQAPAPAAETAADTTAAGEWRKASPEDIKNPVTLFAKDWMALAAGHKGDMNAMTVGWGTVGQLWGKPVVTVYVRESRYTYDFMERNAYFTLTAFPESKRKALEYLGSHSGRDEKDKAERAGLTAEFTELGNPIFAEATLAIECRVLYKEEMKKELMDADVQKDCYGRDEKSIHVMYVGEIVNVWKK